MCSGVSSCSSTSTLPTTHHYCYRYCTPTADKQWAIKQATIEKRTKDNVIFCDRQRSDQRLTLSLAALQCAPLLTRKRPAFSLRQPAAKCSIVSPEQTRRLRQFSWFTATALHRLLYFRDLTLLCTHTHPFDGPLSRTTRVSQYQKGKPIWILLKQETVSGNGISWAICKSAPRSRQITMPAPHHCFYRPDALPVAQPTASKH